MALPPVVVAPPPVVVQPPVNPNVPREEVQQFIAKNLGPNDRDGALAPNGPLWAKVRQVVEKRQFRQIGPDAAGQQRFEDTLPGGGVLVGFFLADDGDGHVAYLQPIYLTAQGEKTGRAYGEVLTRPVQCFKAKAGYAVGAINTRTGAILDALAVQFDRVQGEKLNGADAYASPWVGGQGGGPNAYASNGPLVVGIYGTLNEGGFITPAGSPSAVGLLTMP
jgi:hypothetical protein